MKHKKLFSLISFSCLLLVGCNKNPTVDPTINPEPVGPTPFVNTEKKVELNYNYHDVKSNYVYKNNALPSLGNPRILVLPIYFSDSNNYVINKENVRNDIDFAFFGTSENVGFESVSSYYKKLSDGKCNIEGIVAPWYELSSTSTTFTTLSQEKTIIEDAVNNYFDISNDIRSSYDQDNDGFIDAVVMIYAAPTYDALGYSEYNNLWYFTNWMNDAASDLTNPTPSVYMWGSYCGMYGSNTATSRAGSNYASGNTENCSIDTHAYIHEVGHILGLPDYYDYSYQASPAGGFSMQDHNVGSHDPFSAMALGWVNPYIPTENCKIEIGTFQTTHDLILLSNSFNKDGSPFDEYFLLELYSSEGLNEFDVKNRYGSKYPKGVDEIGIRLWHVDARLAYTSNEFLYQNQITTNPLIQGNKVMEMMSNSYAGDYASRLGSSYYNYNILQLIRNNTLDTYKTASRFSGPNLFKDGSYFSIDTYKKQFVNSTKMNNGDEFDWTFTVSITDNKALIEFERN